jgi:hypothetical protein
MGEGCKVRGSESDRRFAGTPARGYHAIVMPKIRAPIEAKHALVICGRFTRN